MNYFYLIQVLSAWIIIIFFLSIKGWHPQCINSPNQREREKGGGCFPIPTQLPQNKQTHWAPEMFIYALFHQLVHFCCWWYYSIYWIQNTYFNQGWQTEDKPKGLICNVFGTLKMQDYVDIWRKYLFCSLTLNNFIFATCFFVVFSLYLFNID